MKLKNILMTGVMALASMASANASSYNRGDLVLGFSAAANTTGADTNFVIDLGAANYFRDLTATAQLATIGTQLSSIYGANWYSRTDLYWGVVATTAKTGGAVSGDPAKTSYITLAEATYGTHNAGPSFGTTARSSVNTSIYAFSDAFATAAGANATSGISMASTAYGQANSWSAYNNDGNWFSTGISVVGAVGNGTDSSSAAIDLFRILNSTSGANPTGTVGTGSYEGSFTINNSGVVSFTNDLQVVPEPSTYAMLCVGAVGLLGVIRRRRLVQA